MIFRKIIDEVGELAYSDLSWQFQAEFIRNREIDDK